MIENPKRPQQKSCLAYFALLVELAAVYATSVGLVPVGGLNIRVIHSRKTTKSSRSGTIGKLKFYSTIACFSFYHIGNTSVYCICFENS